MNEPLYTYFGHIRAVRHQPLQAIVSSVSAMVKANNQQEAEEKLMALVLDEFPVNLGYTDHVASVGFYLDNGEVKVVNQW